MSRTISLPRIDSLLPKTTRLELDKKQIRILCLLPGGWPDPIRCTLYTAYLDDLPHYEALSYAWGDPAIRKPIFVNGRVFHVTVNLEAALRRLRCPSKERHLWVDALCINQADIIEKSHQVNLMKKIYSNTKCAILWLGDYDEGSLLSALQPSCYERAPSPCLSDYAKSGQNPSRTTVVKAFSFLKLLARHEDLYSLIPSGDRSEEVAEFLESVDDIYQVLNMPWWERIWTVQEALLPAQAVFQFGSMQLPRDEFVRGAEQEKAIFLSAVVRGRYSDPLTYLEYIMGNDHYFYEILAMFRSRKANDPRDKVFALLGLVSEDELPFPADYTIPCHRVYTQTATWMIRSSGTLEAIVRGAEGKRDPKLPSWVPDWSATGDHGTNALYRDGHIWAFIEYCLYDAAKGSDLHFDFSLETELKLKGFRVDIISGLLERPRIPEIRQTDHFQYLCSSCKAYQQAVLGATTRQRGDRLYGSEQPYLSEICLSDLENAQLFITDTGLIGSGPRDTCVGDTVYIFSGGEMPFVVRSTHYQREQGQQYFQYVGHAYVHGIMDGQAVTPDTEWTWITLV
ncbi:heterokaryon incompatibility protein-domain-containing protein [Hypoxylon sp. FL0890]|nr:heterokaryon incompatibility protein-domain-containing protein [Hypoxylon sp. FL0890]